jgi:hypothetical protein
VSTGEYIALLVAGYALGQFIVLLIVTFDTWGEYLLWALHPLAPIWNAYINAWRELVHR